MTTEYTLVSLTTTTHKLENGGECGYGRRCAHCHAHVGINPSIVGAALRVPPPPDYSTPKAVTARIYEAAHSETRAMLAASRDTKFRGLYREFRKAAGNPSACRVEDLHVSKWDVVMGTDGKWDLAPAKPKTQAKVVRMSKSAAAVELGRKGGSAKSDAKTQAARLNGRKGGRPRKAVAA